MVWDSSGEGAQFSTAVRGYQRAAVDEVIARETERVRELQDRADRLERTLAVLNTAAGVPTRKYALRQAVEVVSRGWDDAVAITMDAEHAVGQERARAEGVAATHRALAEQHALEAEMAAQAQVDRMIAAARAEAARLLADGDAATERARVGAAALTAAAAERAKEIARGFTETLRSLEEDVVSELTERQAKADREVEAAAAALRRAKRDAEFAEEQAKTQRVALLAEARVQAGEVEESARTRMVRLQQETDTAVGALAELMISAGGRLTVAKPAVPGQAPAAKNPSPVPSTV